MSIADKLRKVLEIKNDIKASLEEVGVEVTDDFSSYATEISNLSSGSEPEIPEIPDPPVIEIPELPSYEDVYAEALASIPPAQEPEPWTRPEEWIDLRAVLAENVIEEYPYRIALLIKDRATSDLISPGKVKLSDGTEYEVTTSKITHTWTGEATNGYRWMIFYYNTPDIKFSGGTKDYIHIIFDGVNVNVVDKQLGGSTVYGLSSSSRKTRAIEGINGAFIYGLSSGYNYSPISGIYDLEYFTPDILKVNTSSYFSNCYSLKTIPEGVDFSECTSFGSMFNGCTSLTTIPELNTTNGTSFGGMFSGCTSLTTIPLIDTTNGTSFSYMFEGCSSLVTIPQIDTTNGTSFKYMFEGCSSLVTIPQIDTTNGTSFERMFTYCYSLVTIPQLNTTNGTSFNYMFYNCTSLVTIPELNTTNGTDFNSMFCNCGSLLIAPSLDIRKKGNYSSSISYLFSNCSSLITIPDLKVDNDILDLSIFGSCDSIKYLPAIKVLGNKFGTSLLSFKNLETIVSITFPNNDFSEALDLTSLQNLKYIGRIEATGCTSYKLPTSIRYIEHLDTSSVTNFYRMFYNCSSLVTIPELNTTNGTDFSYMFNGCTSLTTIPLIDTTNGTSFSYMFNGCTSLVTIPQIDTTNGTNFNYMFNGCTSLVTIPQLNTTNGTRFDCMFNGCTSLVTIPQLNTTNGTNFNNMFYNCTSLVTVQGEEFNFGKDTSPSSVFAGCRKLKQLPVLNCPNATSIKTSMILGSYNDNSKIVYSLESIGGLLSPKATSVQITESYDSSKQFLNLKSVGILDISSATGTFYIPGKDRMTSLKFVGSVNCKLEYYPTYSSGATPTYRNNFRDLEIESINYDQNFSYWKCLTKQSLLNILNALVQLEEGVTKTLTLNGTYHMSKLTDEEKAIAINKGWTISESNV